MPPKRQQYEREAIIDEWPLIGNEILRLTLIQKSGRYWIDARQWWRDSGGELVPGWGVRCPARLVGELRAALVELEDEAEAWGPEPYLVRQEATR